MRSTRLARSPRVTLLALAADLPAAGRRVLRSGFSARGRRSRSGLYHLLFLFLVVLNLVASFQALGTLMAVGLMMLPAAAARFWAREVWSLALAGSAMGKAVASMDGCLANVIGLPLCHLKRNLDKWNLSFDVDLSAACQAHLAYACPVSADILAWQQ